MNDPAIRIDGISKRFGSVRALDDVSFDVHRQAVYGLLGPNGAGKTTLFSVIANFLQPNEGRVEVLGVDVRNISALQGRLAILPQDALFERNVPILEQLAFFRVLAGSSRAEAEAEVQKALELVGLSEHLHGDVQHLSHGMVKRLGIAQAFLGDPEVILLDEPTAGLDPKNASQIRAIIRDLRSRATILISSHNLAEIQDLCDHVAILDRGRLVACGAVDELTRAGQKVDLGLGRELESSQVESLESIDGVTDCRMVGRARYTLTLDLTARLPEPPDRPAETGGGGEAFERNRQEAVDAILAEVLRALLEWGAIPRELREGNTLEAHFLEVTGRPSDPPVGARGGGG